MALFFLSYDLRNKRDYQSLYDELEKFNAIRVLESCWCFKRFQTNPEGLRNHFMKFIDEDDGLMISQVADVNRIPQWAGYKLDVNPNDL